MGEFRSGFVALIGRPNSGKSTLLNTVLGESLAITSPLPQTTRKIFKGILTDDDCQIIFTDTPGIHKGTHEHNNKMYDDSMSMFEDKGIDVIAYLVDLSRRSGEEEEEIASSVAKYSGKVIIIFNKIDICEEPDLLIASFFEKFPKLSNLEYLKISALDELSKEMFIELVKKELPEGPLYFERDQITDESVRFFASELIRKEIIDTTTEEIPHASFVEIISYKETEEKDFIDADIHVETMGQKAILIGKKGLIINKIKKRSQYAIKKLIGKPVKLKCFVKVTKDWRNSKGFLSEFNHS